MNMFVKGAFVASVVLAGLSSGVVFADDSGSVHVAGTIVDASCLIASSQLTRTVDFGDIDAHDVSGVGVGAVVKTEPLAFDITDCPASTNQVGIRFDYTANADGQNYLQNTGDAAGALFGISSDADDTAVASGTALYAASITDGAATVNAKANLYHVDDTYTPGSLTSTANVTLVYN
ncbi:TPA: fimbrial protein [Escherichia coli]